MNEKQQRAILLMSEGRMCQEVAEALGVTPKTISQWRADPEFRAALNQHLHNIRETHSERLRNLQGLALKTIEDCLNDPELSVKDKLAAAFKTLELGGTTVTQPGSTSVDAIKAEDSQGEMMYRLLSGV
jgi:hypothetical protein